MITKRSIRSDSLQQARRAPVRIQLVWKQPDPALDHFVLVSGAATSFRQRVACTEDSIPWVGSPQRLWFTSVNLSWQLVHSQARVDLRSARIRMQLFQSTDHACQFTEHS